MCIFGVLCNISIHEDTIAIQREQARDKVCTVEAEKFGRNRSSGRNIGH